MRALVLSGGGLFGAWQAGAWAALESRFHPELIVGASAGALNAYAIACGVSAAQLREMWLRPELCRFSGLHANLRQWSKRGTLQLRLAVILTDVLRMKPVIVQGDEVNWRHLAASCAVPLVLPQVRIGGRWYSDGGLLNPLPVWAAVELGATEIVALNALPRMPSALLRPLVSVFRAVFGHHPPVPDGVQVEVLKPVRDLGSLRDSMRWKKENIERWLAQGESDAQAIAR